MAEGNYELKMEAAVGAKQTLIYVEEHFEKIAKTNVAVYYVGKTGKYKHFAFTLAPGKTRVNVTDLVDGTYEVQATQYSEEGETVSGTSTFEFMEPTLDLIDAFDDLKAEVRSIEKKLAFSKRD